MDGSDRPGERLAHHADSWEDLKASPEVVKLIRYGHKISFHKKPPLSEPKPEFATTAPLKQLDVIRKEVKVLVKKGAMRKVPYAEAMKSKGFYSKLFCVPKPGDKWRPVINMKPLNQFVNKKGLKMEGAQEVRNVLQPGMYGAIVDLSDAYYHVRLHKASRRYTRFILDGVIYEYLALPMGLTCSLRIFTRITKFFMARLRRQGLIVIIYIE